MGYRLLSVVSLLVCMWTSIAWAALPLPEVDGEAVVLMVGNTKEVVFSKKPDDFMYPASTTKIMTLLTALEKGDPNRIITVSPRAAACDGSSLELKSGDKMTLRNAMYGMMLVSGNDAAEAIAENVSGSIAKFVEIMNGNAQKIGAVHTHFTNPHGLPDPYNHFTTAYDLALITDYAMQNAEFAKIVGTKEYNVDFLSGKKVHVFNTNKLLKTYRGANGGKTGYTNAAGECLVAAAKRDGVQLIVVILNSEHRWSDATKLFDYGFAQLGL